MEFASINLSLIDFEDETFLVGNKDNLSSLQSSIEEIGLLNPPILRDRGGSYQIVNGWKRFVSCRELGYKEVLCKVYSSSELSDTACIKIIYTENKDRLSDIELSELILLYKQSCSISDKDLINKILPLFEIPPSRKHLDKFLALASLEKEIKNTFYKGEITIEQCQMLSEISKSNQLPVLKNLLLKYNLNNNESRQVIQIVEEIALRDLKSIDKVIFEAESVIENENKSKIELRRELRKIRYPELSKVEEDYKKALDDLKIPKQINLFINQFFEGNDLELRIKIKSPEELSLILSYLENSVDNGSIEKLLDIINKGHE